MSALCNAFSLTKIAIIYIRKYIQYIRSFETFHIKIPIISFTEVPCNLKLEGCQPHIRDSHRSKCSHTNWRGHSDSLVNENGTASAMSTAETFIPSQRSNWISYGKETEKWLGVKILQLFLHSLSWSWYNPLIHPDHSPHLSSPTPNEPQLHYFLWFPRQRTPRCPACKHQWSPPSSRSFCSHIYSYPLNCSPTCKQTSITSTTSRTSLASVSLSVSLVFIFFFTSFAVCLDLSIELYRSMRRLRALMVSSKLPMTWKISHRKNFSSKLARRLLPLSVSPPSPASLVQQIPPGTSMVSLLSWRPKRATWTGSFSTLLPFSSGTLASTLTWFTLPRGTPRLTWKIPICFG